MKNSSHLAKDWLKNQEWIDGLQESYLDQVAGDDPKQIRFSQEGSHSKEKHLLIRHGYRLNPPHTAKDKIGVDIFQAEYSWAFCESCRLIIWKKVRVLNYKTALWYEKKFDTR